VRGDEFEQAVTMDWLWALALVVAGNAALFAVLALAAMGARRLRLRLEDD
jgi:hypothetical protein